MAELVQGQSYVEAKTYVSEGGITNYATTRKLRFAKTSNGRLRLPMVGATARGSYLEIKPEELREVLGLLFAKDTDES